MSVCTMPSYLKIPVIEQNIEKIWMPYVADIYKTYVRNLNMWNEVLSSYPETFKHTKNIISTCESELSMFKHLPAYNELIKGLKND